MQVYIGDLKEKVELNTLDTIKTSGDDGRLYIDGDRLIKICTSHFMTLDKFQDFAVAKQTSFQRGNDPEDSTIIFPEDEVSDSPIRNLRIGRLLGYTEHYQLERKDGIRRLKTETFVTGAKQIRDDIHTFLSSNDIAIVDTNPKNLLVTEDGRMFLIDHDRSLTRHTISQRNEILGNNFYYHNEMKFSSLIRNALILQMLYGLEFNDEVMRMYLRYKQEEDIREQSLNNKLFELRGYDTVKDYAEDKARELHLR